MACDPKIAKLLSHIAACRTAELPGARLEFRSGGQVLGYVTADFAARLAGDEHVTVADRVEIKPGGLARLNEVAAGAGCRFRGEDFDVRAVVEGPVLGVLDRGALPDFGVIGVGAHLNGLVERADGWWLWVAKRAADKKLDPSKLDHLVAGGVSAGMSPFETLVKEAEEEAALPEVFARQATLRGRFAYNMERDEGLRRDVIYAYDVVLPESFVPRPADGEVEGFELMRLADVFERVAGSDDFKFNVNLVLIDLFVRFGLVAGEDAALLHMALLGER